MLADEYNQFPAIGQISRSLSPKQEYQPTTEYPSHVTTQQASFDKVAQLPWNSANKFSLIDRSVPSQGVTSSTFDRRAVLTSGGFDPDDSGEFVLSTMMGATEKVLALCDKILIDGLPQELDSARMDDKKWEQAGEGRRTLGRWCIGLATTRQVAYLRHLTAGTETILHILHS